MQKVQKLLQEKGALNERQSAHQGGLKEVSSSLLHQQHHEMTPVRSHRKLSTTITEDSPCVCHFPTHCVTIMSTISWQSLLYHSSVISHLGFNMHIICSCVLLL